MDILTHSCGGAILTAEICSEKYTYCNTCCAFAFEGAVFPSGTDIEQNRQAWDDAESHSPGDVKEEKSRPVKGTLLHKNPKGELKNYGY